MRFRQIASSARAIPLSAAKHNAAPTTPRKVPMRRMYTTNAMAQNTAKRALEAYKDLTDSLKNFLRVDELCRRGSEKFSDLLPSPEALAREAQLKQKDKQGLEKQQGEFLAEVLNDAACGTHLCHAMLLPRQE